MNVLKTLFKQTFIYGLATVLPRMLSFLLVAFHTKEGVLQNASEYGQISKIFAWFVLINVLLAYGMETAFFRFYGKTKGVASTAALSLLFSSLIFCITVWSFQHSISSLIKVDIRYFHFFVWILLLDALAIIPFSALRANQRPMRYATVKIINVITNFGLNIVFLLGIKQWATKSTFWAMWYIPNYEIGYVLIANLVASAVTLLLVSDFYTKINYRFDFSIWKRMLRYAYPILIAGIAFSINEVADRILLDYLLPTETAEYQIGVYAACYKLGLFMMLFSTAYKLGVEPFFFHEAGSKNASKNYALLLEFFVFLGALMLLAVSVYTDILKQILVRSEEYWMAIDVVPIILIAHFCLGIYHNLSVWYKTTDKTKYGAYISVLGALITIIINISLIPIIGYMASAYATLVAYSSMMILSFLLSRKHYPIPYNLKKISLYLLLSILFSILSFYVFDRNLWVGNLLLGLFLWICIRFEKENIQRIFLRKNNS